MAKLAVPFLKKGILKSLQQKNQIIIAYCKALEHMHSEEKILSTKIIKYSKQ